jgi:hypothetical protein
MSDKRCADCKAYLDGLTPDANPHPIADDLCVRCGNEWVKKEGWGKAEQKRRESVIYDNESNTPHNT